MKAIILSVMLLIILFIFTSEINISFKPFSISTPYWIKGIGACLICLGIVLWGLGETQRGFKEGLEKGFEITIETLKEIPKNPKDHE